MCLARQCDHGIASTVPLLPASRIGRKIRLNDVLGEHTRTRAGHPSSHSYPNQTKHLAFVAYDRYVAEGTIGSSCPAVNFGDLYGLNLSWNEYQHHPFWIYIFKQRNTVSHEASLSYLIVHIIAKMFNGSLFWSCVLTFWLCYRLSILQIQDQSIYSGLVLWRCASCCTHYGKKTTMKSHQKLRHRSSPIIQCVGLFCGSFGPN